MNRDFPLFIDDLSRQDRELGRAAMVEFEDDGDISTTIFTDSEHMRSHLDANSVWRTPDCLIPGRRLLVMEDLSVGFIDVLGSRFRVPPSFFAAHFEAPWQSHTLSDRIPLGQECRSRFMLRYPIMHRISPDGLIKGFTDKHLRLDTHVDRRLDTAMGSEANEVHEMLVTRMESTDQLLSF